MTKTLTAALAMSTALTAVLGLTSIARAQEPAARTSTEWTRNTGHPRAPEQLAMQFDKADLAFRILPETRSIEGVATLDFTATAPLARLVLDAVCMEDAGGRGWRGWWLGWRAGAQSFGACVHGGRRWAGWGELCCAGVVWCVDIIPRHAL